MSRGVNFMASPSAPSLENPGDEALQNNKHEYGQYGTEIDVHATAAYPRHHSAEQRKIGFGYVIDVLVDSLKSLTLRQRDPGEQNADYDQPIVDLEQGKHESSHFTSPYSRAFKVTAHDLPQPPPHEEKHRVLRDLPVRLLQRSVSYTHLRAHETKANLVCRLLLE